MSAIDQTRPVTDSLLNFRDLGGLATTDGRTVRPGLLFRSDDIGALEVDAWRSLQDDLGLVTAVDMRSGFEDEMAEGAKTIDGGAVVHRIPILDGSMMHAAQSGEIDLATMYSHIVHDSGESLAAGVTAVAEAMPALVFCTAGKDRTGMLIALLLAAIGVRREDVVADYTRSADAGPALRTRMYERFGDRAPEVPDVMFTAPSDAIEQVLDEVVTRHGSVVGYWRAHGVDPAALAHIEGTLLG